jgi:hypothetical protein
MTETFFCLFLHFAFIQEALRGPGLAVKDVRLHKERLTVIADQRIVQGGLRRLSITHNFTRHGGAEFNISEARQPAPHYSISGWRVIGSGEIAAEPSNFD